jgi:aspartate kinase
VDLATSQRISSVSRTSPDGADPTGGTSSSAPRERTIIVQKYGGSSVADVAKIGRVADKVVAARKAGHDVVVVVSAMGKTTDSLLALAHDAASLEGHKIEPARRELDMLLSTGERVAMSLLSIAIQARGVSAISFTGSQSGILTNDRHFDARIIEVRPHRIEDELHRGQVVIVAGYQGMSYRREITTLGRGGSDTTAVALAAALGAERCEIYSDVDGVYSADPRVVPDARHLPELDLEILQEMSESGAKVLCAQAIEWARRKGIVIHAASTFDDRRETIVRPSSGQARATARAVALEPKALLVEVRASLDALVDELVGLGLAFKELTATSEGARFVVPLTNVPSPDAAVSAIGRSFPGAEVRGGVSVLSVVGDGLAGTAEPLRRFLSALRSSGVDPVQVFAGPLKLSAVVPAGATDAAQRALHQAFDADL